MAPKKLPPKKRGKTNQPSTSQAPTLPFVDEPVHPQWFSDPSKMEIWPSFHRRNVCLERGIHFNDFKHLNIKPYFDSSLLSNTFSQGRCYNRLVKLFYCNIDRPPKQPFFTTRVQIKLMTITPALINEFLHIPPNLKLINPWGHTLESIHELVPNLDATSAFKIISWKPYESFTHIREIHLPHLYTLPRLVCHSFSYNILPKGGNRAGMGHEQLVCAVLVSLSLPVDWGTMIFKSMVEDIHRGHQKKILPYGVLISNLCVASGLNVDKELDWTVCKEPYSVHTLLRMGIRQLFDASTPHPEIASQPTRPCPPPPPSPDSAPQPSPQPSPAPEPAPSSSRTPLTPSLSRPAEIRIMNFLRDSMREMKEELIRDNRASYQQMEANIIRSIERHNRIPPFAPAAEAPEPPQSPAPRHSPEPPLSPAPRHSPEPPPSPPAEQFQTPLPQAAPVPPPSAVVTFSRSKARKVLVDTRDASTSKNP